MVTGAAVIVLDMDDLPRRVIAARGGRNVGDGGLNRKSDRELTAAPALRRLLTLAYRRAEKYRRFQPSRDRRSLMSGG
jgi:hypothetical protein